MHTTRPVGAAVASLVLPAESKLVLMGMTYVLRGISARKVRVVRKRTKTNTAALVAAVLVATLSLCINQIFRITPKQVDAMMGSFQSLKSVSRDFMSGVAADNASQTSKDVAPRKPSQIIADLEQLKKMLDVFLAAFVQTRTRQDEKLKPIGTVVRKASAALESQSDGIPSDQLIHGRMLIFENLFLVAGMNPEEYSADFEAAGDLLLSDPNFTQREAIELFRAFHSLQLHTDPNGVVLQKLRDYSVKQPDHSFAIQLYPLVADMMKRNGRPQLSCLVLRQGMDIYRNHKDRPRLVNQLIDLKIRELGKN